ncbi:MAG: DUF4038 domain-containing protein [Armatimonadetes bacterium]|nr:DUF4038 domain-containing protein [Armatimonadota bacterium]
MTSLNRVAERAFISTVAYTDPFGEVTLDALVTDPAGVTRRVPAFWAGGDAWKVRYASPLAGEHTLVTACSDPANAGLHAQTATITVSEAAERSPLYAHGPLTVTGDQRHFEHADGTPFFWLGDTWWMGLCGRLRWPEEFGQLAADRLAKGFSVVQIVAGLYPDMPAFDPRGANEAGFPWTEGFGTIRPEYFDRVDERLAYLIDVGLMPCLVGAWGYFVGWMGVHRLKAHWRYLLARYAAYPMVWCVAGESNLPYYLAEGFPYDDRAAVTQWTDVARYIRAIDPWQRPLSIHPTGLGRLSSRGAIDDESLIEFDMLQTGHGNREVLAPTVDTLLWSLGQSPTMPVLNSEVAYEGLMGTITTDTQRLMFWASVLSGACGHTYGANGIWQCNRAGQPHGASPHGGNYGVTPWEEAMAYPGSGQLGWAKGLLCGYDWWRFESHPEWAELTGEPSDSHDRAYCAGLADQVRFIYAPSRRALRPAALSGEWRATAYDPATGQATPLGAVVDGQVCEPPAGEAPDWLLVLEGHLV